MTALPSSSPARRSAPGPAIAGAVVAVPGHLRAGRLRGEARLLRLSRRADRPAEPAGLPRPAPARARRSSRSGRGPCGALRRRRPVQGRERQPRPPRRRPGSRRRSPSVSSALVRGGGHPRALRRRRVHAAARGHRRRRRGRGGRGADDRSRPRADRDRRRADRRRRASASGSRWPTAGSTPDDSSTTPTSRCTRRSTTAPDRYAVFDARAMGARSPDRVDLEAGLRRAIDSGELTRLVPADVRDGDARDRRRSRRSCAGTTPSAACSCPALHRASPRRPASSRRSGVRSSTPRPRRHSAGGATRALPCYLAVNLSARQFESPGLVREVGRALASSGLDPARLCLEITETPRARRHRAVGRHPRRAEAARRHARDRRLRDRLLLAHLLEATPRRHREARPLVRPGPRRSTPSTRRSSLAVVDLARTIGMTRDRRRASRHPPSSSGSSRWGAPSSQGFLLGAPMGADEIAELLRRQVEREVPVLNPT